MIAGTRYPASSIIDNRLIETARCRLAEAAISAAMGVNSYILRAATRHKRHAAFARQMAGYLAHTALGVNLTATGRAFGRDRTTIRYACRILEDSRDHPSRDALLNALQAGLTAQMRELQSLPEVRS